MFTFSTQISWRVFFALCPSKSIIVNISLFSPLTSQAQALFKVPNYCCHYFHNLSKVSWPPTLLRNIWNMTGLFLLQYYVWWQADLTWPGTALHYISNTFFSTKCPLGNPNVGKKCQFDSISPPHIIFLLWQVLLHITNITYLGVLSGKKELMAV